MAVDPFDARQVYVTLSGYRSADYLPHVFYSSNAGEDWEDISSNLPEIPVNDIIVDPDIVGALYVATDLGVWYSEDSGESWSPLGTDMPATVVTDLSFEPVSRTLTAATFGRSIWRYQLREPSSTTDPVDQVDLGAYPNPASSVVTIECDAFKTGSVILSIYATDGSAVGAHSVHSREQTYLLDVSNLTPGAYNIVATNNGQLIGSTTVIRQ